MNGAVRRLLAAFDGLYNQMLRHLIASLTAIAVFALMLHALTVVIGDVMGLEEAMSLWAHIAWKMQAPPLLVRLLVSTLWQVLCLVIFRGPIHRLAVVARSDLASKWPGFVPLESEQPEDASARSTAYEGVGLHIALAVLAVPVLAQPTIVPLDMGPMSTIERVTNTLDGTAVLASRESFNGFYHRFLKPDRLTYALRGTTDDGFERTLLMSEREDRAIEAGDVLATLIAPDDQDDQPMMDRWDALIWEAAGNDPTRFAHIKAVMWVESAGRQFAVSRTGCMGLMQFCSGTARSAPFQTIFGRGEVFTCRCGRTSCRVERATQREMESGDASLIARHSGDYPCDVQDARFDGRKSIFAGARYLADLDEELGGNLALMYIGYNSGPHVARRAVQMLGGRTDASLNEIGTVLTAAMKPYHGSRSARRARGLLERHLPKLMRAFERYEADAYDTHDPMRAIAAIPQHDALGRPLKGEAKATPSTPSAPADLTADAAVADVEAAPKPQRPSDTTALPPTAIDRTGDGFEGLAEHSPPTLAQEHCVVPPKTSLSKDAVAIPFMEGITLNVPRDEVLAQEGSGRLDHHFKEQRQLAIHHDLHERAEALTGTSRALVPPLAYIGRYVFGLESERFTYTMNPHTGRYDDLRIALTTRRDAPQRFRRYHTLRARLSEALGAPIQEELLVRHEDVGEALRPRDMDSSWRSHRVRTRSVWRTKNLGVELVSRGGRPDGQRHYVADLYIWASSADTHFEARASRWEGFATFALPDKEADLLYTANSAQHPAPTPLDEATAPSPAAKRQRATERTPSRKETKKAQPSPT